MPRHTVHVPTLESTVRAHFGLSQAELARFVGVSRSPLATVEAGRNALGQAVRRFALPAAKTTVYLRGLAPGVYTLRLALDGQPVTRRVVVE